VAAITGAILAISNEIFGSITSDGQKIYFLKVVFSQGRNEGFLFKLIVSEIFDGLFMVRIRTETM
jgi:hypothetical protein